jgi:hypothetical protein
MVIDVTDTKHKPDIWTDPDPQPEDVEAWFADPTNEYRTVHVPRNSTLVVFGPKGVSDEEWEARRTAAHARGERLPEEIEAEARLAAAQAEEEKDWTPEQKAAREAERSAAREALEKRHH